MTIAQAKEVLEKWKYRGSDGLTDEKLGYIEGWYHKKDDSAFEMAIKSLEKVEELERWNKVLQDRIGFFEKKQGCEYCASEPLGDYCNLEYYNKYLLEIWDKIKEELENEIKEYDNVITDLDYATGVGYALEVINKHLGE